jgi:hypothetical protein
VKRSLGLQGRLVSAQGRERGRRAGASTEGQGRGGGMRARGWCGFAVCTDLLSSRADPVPNLPLNYELVISALVFSSCLWEPRRRAM